MINRIKKLLNEIKLKYPSDEIRLSYIEDALKEPISDKEPSHMEILNSDDWTIVRNFGNKIIYYEFWGKPCWDALFQKEEYRGLTRKEAIDKFIIDRFTPMVNSIGYNVGKVNFRYNFMRIELIKR